MSDILSTAVQWLADQLHDSVASTVTYERPNRSPGSVTVSASRGRSLLKLADEFGGVQMRWTECDFLIRAADLVLGDVPITPQRGDKIRLADGVIYEVVAPAGEPEWRWADPYHTIIRIHAKQVRY